MVTTEQKATADVSPERTQEVDEENEELVEMKALI